MKIPILIIAGPTASGKTGLSVEVAKRFNGEIVSADSMQIYRHMNIGTAKPSMEERQGIIHHLMDVVDPWETFTVAQYQSMAAEAIRQIFGKGKLPIVVGGTGLYINALTRGWTFSQTPPSLEVREKIQELLDQEGKMALHERLEKVDPVSAESIHPNNVKRVMRALEVYWETGTPKSVLDERSQQISSVYDYSLVGLTMDRQKLYRRIEERIDIMLEEGLVDEVKKLVEMGANETWQSMQGLGYKEILAYLKGEIPFEEAVRILKRDTRRYAKRQWTWFRRLEETHWLDLDLTRDLEEKVKYIQQYIKDQE